MFAHYLSMQKGEKSARFVRKLIEDLKHYVRNHMAVNSEFGSLNFEFNTEKIKRQLSLSKKVLNCLSTIELRAIKL